MCRPWDHSGSIKIFLRCMIELCASMAGLGSSRVATPVGERNAAMCPGMIFALPGAAFSMMSIGDMYQRRAGLGSSWVAHVLFSVRVLV